MDSTRIPAAARQALIALTALLLAAGIAPGGDEKRPWALDFYTGEVIIHSNSLDTDFVPDGNPSKPVWDKTPWVRYSREFQGEEDYYQTYTDVASRWSKDYIYFAYRARYTTLNTFEGEDPTVERWKLWERDVVEVFLNPRPKDMLRYYEFEVAPNNQWLDLDIDLDREPYTNQAWNSGFEHATHIDENGKFWTCELRIPLRSMDAKIRAGDEWRINFFRMDGKEEGSKPRHLISWSSITAPHNGFHTPSRFGIIRFVK